MKRVGGVAAGGILVLGLALVPVLTRRDDVLNAFFVLLLSVTLAESLNVIAGFAGQVNLGHAAFFGTGALVVRTLWIGGAPVVVALVAGAAAAMVLGLAVGGVALRLRGAYFAIGTLAVGEIFRITVGNLWPDISTLSESTIAGYRLVPRYYGALALAALAVAVTAAVAGSRLGLALEAVRDDEEAAEATGVAAFRLKLVAFAISTALAGLGGGLFAFYQISYYPAHALSPTWTFDALLMTFVGGAGTVTGPVIGAALYVFLKEYLTVRWADFHLLIFGLLFIGIVLVLPGGATAALSRLFVSVRRACGPARARRTTAGHSA